MFLHVGAFARYEAAEKDLCVGVLMQLGNDILCAHMYTERPYIMLKREESCNYAC